MAIQYDRLHEAYAALRTLRQAFIDGLIDAVKLTEQSRIIENSIREILGLPALP